MTVSKLSHLKSVTSQLLVSLFMLVLSFTTILMFLWEWQDHSASVRSDWQVIVLSSMHGLLPGAFLGLIACASLVLMSVLFTNTSAVKSPIFRRVEKFFGFGILFAVFLLFAGSYSVSQYWQNKAAAAGYSPCPSTALLSNRITMSIWVRTEALCYDQDIQLIVKRGTPVEMLQIEQTLQARKKQQEARLHFLQQEEEIKQRRRDGNGS